jgi:hypothetical protein
MAPGSGLPVLGMAKYGKLVTPRGLAEGIEFLGCWHQEAGRSERRLTARYGLPKEDWPQGAVYLEGLAAGSGLPDRAGRRERFT